MPYIDDSEETKIDAVRPDIDKQLAVIKARMEEIHIDERLEAVEQRMLQLQTTLDKQLQASEERTTRMKEAITRHHQAIEKEIKHTKKELYEMFEVHKRQTKQRIHETVFFPLKSRRNRLAPISKLPVELLSLIFLHYIHDPDLKLSEEDLHHQRYTGRNIEPDPCLNIKWADIMRVVRVCRTWREVALQTPDFWSQTLVFSERIMIQMLDRSKESLLYVRLSDSFAVSDARALLMHNMKRVRELHLDTSSSQIDKTLEIISPSKKSPELRSLYIRGSDGRGRCSVGLSNLYLTYTTNLQYLDISQHRIDWDPLHKAAKGSGFARLVSLKLADSHSDSSVERGAFYDILSAMPSLQFLSLAGTLPPYFPDQQALERRVSLPCLSSCTLLSSPPSECADFHMHVSYPATTAKLHFQTNIDAHVPVGNDPDTLSTLLDFWGLSKANPKRVHSNLLLVIVRRGARFQVKAVLWDGPFPKSLQNYDCEQPSVILNFVSTGFELSSRFLELIFIPGLSNIGLKLIGNPEFTRRPFFRRHEQVTHLHIESIFAREALYGLSASESEPTEVHEGSSSHRSPLYLPNLRKLVLEGHGEPLDRISLISSAEMMADVKALRADLKVRCNHNSPLQELHFSSCYGWRPTWFRKLSELRLAKTVTWSGLAPPYESEGDSDSDDSYVPGSDGDDSDEEGGDGDSEEWPDDTASESDHTDDDFWH